MGVAQVKRQVDPANTRTVIHLKDEPDEEERLRSARKWAEKGKATREKIRGLRNKVRAEYKRGDRLFRLAQAYTVQAIARRYGLTRGQVTAMCRRLP